MAPTISSFSTASRAWSVPPKIVIDLTSSSSSSAAGPPKVVIDLVSPSSSSSAVSAAISTEDEATSRPGRKGPYRRWYVEDEVKILTTIADLRRRNLGVMPKASVILKALNNGTALGRPVVDVVELSQKVFNMKKAFKEAAAREFAARRRFRRRRTGRNSILYKKCAEVWPDLLAEAKRRANAPPSDTLPVSCCAATSIRLQHPA